MFVALVLLASRDAGAVIDPGPPAPLTGTKAFVELAPHLSADGSALAFAGSQDLLGLRWERFLLDLSPGCWDSPLLRLTDDDEPSGATAWFDVHPSVSGDGRFVAWATFTGLVLPLADEYLLQFLDRDTGTVTPVATILTQIHSGPRPTLSSDGHWLFAIEANDPIALNFKHVRRFATPAADCTEDCECTVTVLESQTDTPPLASTHAAASADGRYLVGLNGASPTSEVRRVDFEDGSCFDYATLAVNERGADDITLSADGQVAAWSTYADYATGGSFADSNVWVWRQAGITATCPGAQCVPSPAGGTLVRIFTDPLQPARDWKPLVSADGRRVFFISTGAYFGENPRQAPALWVVDIDASASWAPQRVSPMEALPLANQVEHATANRDGTAVAYHLFHDTDGDDLADARDLRLVLVDDDTAADLPEPPGLTAALQPYEVQGVTCSHVGGGDVLVRYDVRQFRGGTRQLVTTLEAQAAGGTAVRLGPFLQQLGDERVAEVTRTVALADGDLDDITCRALVLWGAGAQPDAVVATWP